MSCENVWEQQAEEITRLRALLAECDKALEFCMESSGPNKMSETLGTLARRVADVNACAKDTLKKIRGEK